MGIWGNRLSVAGSLLLGIAIATYFQTPPLPVWAGNDRHEDYIMCTGTISFGVLPAPSKPGGVGVGPAGVPNPATIADAVWLLDFRAGKLLGTIVDRNYGKISAWSEVDLVQEFKIPPKQNVHFMMTTGNMVNGNTPLYLTEINTGRFAVYMIVPGPDVRGAPRIVRYDSSQFRPPPANP